MNDLLAVESTPDVDVMEALDAPRPPMILHPEDGDGVEVEDGEGALVRFTWTRSAVLPGCYYQVQISEDPEFLRLVSCMLTSDSRQLPVWLPRREGAYHWRLRAIDRCGRVGAWSAPAAFHLGVASVPESAPDVPEHVGSLLAILKLFRRVTGPSSDPE